MPPVRTATMVLALVATQACCSAAFRPAFTGLAQRSSSRAISVAHRALFSTAADSASEKKPVPVTLLSGFLGTGKTTALKHLLENRDGVKIGVVVNDVASVNIDAKLMSNPGNDGEANGVLTDDMTIELQNGCACCSLADELLTSMEVLMTGRDFDAVVVELSGVADPVSVQQNWEQAKMIKHPATKLADINRIVTVVDSSTFGTDWMTWDSAVDRENWTEEGDDCAGERKVPELLAEQVEAADLLLINKIDIAGPEQTKTARAVARAINNKAGIFETKFGEISPSDILGPPFGEKAVLVKEEKGGQSSSHDHGCCEDPGCTDSSHDHSHDHGSCEDPGCADPDCEDPDCADTSHSHAHSTSTENLGITNFVYKSDRPFNSPRLLGLLNRWPVPIKEELNIIQLKEASEEGIEMEDGSTEKSPFVGVLRSKGFCWLSPVVWDDQVGDSWRHDTAMFWSHAGKHFSINTAGKWWGSIPKDTIKDYFVGRMTEYERIMREDWVSDEWGDRRQELVFIGAGIDEDAIAKALDECLCTDAEYDQYRADLQDYRKSNVAIDTESAL